jgi:hypothetical protein
MVNGTPGVMGAFSSLAGDPANSANASWSDVYEPLSNTGGFDLDFTVEIGAIHDFYVRWYCAPAAIDSLSDAGAITYASPMMKVTSLGAAAALKASMKRYATTGTTASGELLSARSEPNALPLVDKVNITGKNAATLKSYIDGEFAKAEAKKPGSLSGVNQRYVDFTYKTLSGKSASAAKTNAQVAKLTAGLTRVKVIEDIALELNTNPKVWNTLLSTPNVKLAKRVSNVKASIKKH